MANVSINNITETWNASGTTFTGLKYNATDTASAAASKLIDLQIGGSSKFNVDKSGNTVLTGSLAASGYKLNAGSVVTVSGTTRTLSAADDGLILYCTSATAVTITTAEDWDRDSPVKSFKVVQVRSLLFKVRARLWLVLVT